MQDKQTRAAPTVAFALAHAGGREAPRVLAKGRGAIAGNIIARAQHAGVPVHESAPLAAMLAHVDLGEQIPPSLYAAVAELLAWVYRLEHGGATTVTPTSLSIAKGVQR